MAEGVPAYVVRDHEGARGRDPRDLRRPVRPWGRLLKDGNVSACVSRQYTGTAGKVTNCQVGVSLHLASNHAAHFEGRTWNG